LDAFPGAGKVTETRLKHIGIQTVGDLQDLGPAALEAQFAGSDHASTSWLAALPV
jgi:nucleotidyltransferase/DNA polymerase involved in DNA repair